MTTVSYGGRPVRGFAMQAFGLGALIVTASDIEQEQARVLAVAKGVDAAVAACANLDAGTRAEWSTFFASVADFCTRPVCSFWYPGMPANCVMATASSGDTMVAYEKQLAAWQSKLASCGGPPPLPVFQPNAGGLDLTGALKWGTVLVAVVGGVYVVTKLVPSRR